MYRAYEIECADTTACRVSTDNAAELLFLASHVTGGPIAPRFRLEFDDAVVNYDEPEAGITARFQRGAVRRYAAPDDTPQFQKLRAAIELCVRAPKSADEAVICGPEAAAAHTLCVNGMHQSIGEIWPFPSSLVTQHGAPERVSVTGLDEVLGECWLNQRLPAETGASWATPGRRVEISDRT